MIPMPPASSIEVTSEPSSPRSSGSFEYLGTHDTERGTSTMTTPPAPQSPASVSSVESSLPSTASNTSVAATKESIKLSAPQLRDSPPGGPDYRALGMMPVPAPPSVSWYSPVSQIISFVLQVLNVLTGARARSRGRKWHAPQSECLILIRHPSEA